MFNRIVRYFKREATPTPTGTAAVNTTPRTGGVPLWIWGVTAPMQVATVYRCVKLLSESVANLPMQFMRLKDGIFVEDRNSRLWYLLNVQPDYATNAFDFWRRVVQEVLTEGNAYIIPIYNNVSLEIDRLALCGRGTVTHDTINDTYTVSDEDNGIYGRFDESEVIHFKGLTGRNSKVGVSVLEHARLTVEIANTGDTETRNRFANGGNVRGIVSNDTSVRGFGEYQDKQLEKTAENIDSRFQNGERVVSLPGQVDFKQISLSSTDMQFLESRKFTVREICRFFGVHPSFVYDDTSNNYKSAEQANVAFLSHTLAPLLRCIEIELLRKLIAPTLAAKRKFEFQKRGLYACDLEGMTKYRINLLQMGTTVNEIRRMDNLPPVEGGDVVLVSANLRNINDPGSVNAAGGEPTNNKPTNNDDDNTDGKDEE